MANLPTRRTVFHTRCQRDLKWWRCRHPRAESISLQTSDTTCLFHDLCVAVSRAHGRPTHSQACSFSTPTTRQMSGLIPLNDAGHRTRGRGPGRRATLKLPGDLPFWQILVSRRLRWPRHRHASDILFTNVETFHPHFFRLPNSPANYRPVCVLH